MTLAELFNQWAAEVGARGHSDAAFVELARRIDEETKKQQKAGESLFGAVPLTAADLATGATGKALNGGVGVGTIVLVAAGVLGGGYLLLKKRKK